MIHYTKVWNECNRTSQCIAISSIIFQSTTWVVLPLHDSYGGASNVCAKYGQNITHMRHLHI